MNLRRIKALLKKEIRQALRDRRMRIIIFGSPLIQLILFGYAVNTDVRQIPTLVCDHSLTSLSRGLVGAFEANGYFQVVGRVKDAGRPIPSSMRAR